MAVKGDSTTGGVRRVKRRRGPCSGSKGSPKAHDLSFIAHNSVHSGDGDEESKDQWVEVISWEPRAFVFHNFLTKEECEYLISIAEPHMEKSTVVDSETGKSTDSRVRTSSGTFLARGRDKIIRNIEKKIADFTFIPVEHGEGLQILHYEVGQKYEPHYDYFMDEFNTGMVVNALRQSDVEEGGETVFPAAKGNYSSVPWWNELSECGKGGLSVAVLLSKGTSGHLQNGCVSMSTRPNFPCIQKMQEEYWPLLSFIELLCFEETTIASEVGMDAHAYHDSNSTTCDLLASSQSALLYYIYL
ncbi:hypothetical protein DH2020_040352 [Rehmannia glutinosa]|uniref:Prolyl 4-hydroxylase alpha subunit domain-containing protein n=1 Tax=Rehmannia glutinosa TaxID=99300 RepID=A0ABR0UT66_REHGL